MLEYFNQNSGALSVLFAGIVAISTIIYAILTGSLVRETKKMRKVQTEPKIAVYLEQNNAIQNSLDMVIKNIGMGSAHNIKFEKNILIVLLQKILSNKMRY